MQNRTGSRTVGKPANPYTKLDMWSVETAKRLLDTRPADLAAPPGLKHGDLRWAVWGLVHGIGVPVTRRWLQSILVFGLKFHPEDTTDARLDLRHGRYEIPGVVATKHVLGDPLEGRLYTFERKPRAAELGYLRAMIEDRKTWIDLLAGKAGELFVRSAMIATGLYERVTRIDDVGDVYDQNDENKLDLVATDKRSGVRFGVSVKNTNEWLFRGNASIKNAHAMATAHGLAPMLVVPFATSEARKRCKGDGIKLIELGAQVIPAENKDGEHVLPHVEQLAALVGPQPFIRRYAQYREPEIWHGKNPFAG